MAKEILHVPAISDGLKKANVPLSPVVRANGFLFVSGMPPMDIETGKIKGGDIVAQTRGSIEALRHVLESAGSSLDKVVKVTLYISNSAYFPTVNQIYREYFAHEPPARTFVTVGSWPLEFDVEIECIALAE